jgi:cytochrome c oxidase subunit III
MTASTATPYRFQQGSTAKVGLLTVIGSETFFFATGLSVYFFLRLEHPEWSLPAHTPTGLLAPSLNTLLFFASALVIWRALAAARSGRMKTAQALMALTFALGLIFVGGQAFDFSQAGLKPDDAAFGGVFLALMGFHAAHVLAGMAFLAITMVRTRLGDFTAERHTSIILCAWFWYFVVAVWLVLFGALYLI